MLQFRNNFPFCVYAAFQLSIALACSGTQAGLCAPANQISGIQHAYIFYFLAFVQHTLLEKK